MPHTQTCAQEQYVLYHCPCPPNLVDKVSYSRTRMPPHKALSKNVVEWFARVVSDLVGLLTLDAAVLLKLPLHTLAEISKAGCSSTRPYNRNQEDAAEKRTN